MEPRTPHPAAPAGVVLAAGASSRFGAAGPKALALVDGAPAVLRIVEVLAALGVRPTVVVTGAAAPEIARVLADAPATVRYHSRWELGRTGSIAEGLSAVGAAEAAVVWPVDAPFVRRSTVQRLLDQVELGGLAVWWTPTFEGRGGHPIVIARELFRAIAELPPDFPLREAPFRRGPAEVRVPVDDPAVTDNANTPESFRRAAFAWAARGEG